MHCTITGAGGFIGRNLAEPLIRRGHSVARWGRSSGWFDLSAPAHDADRHWIEQLRGTDVVVHLAGRAHVMRGDIEREGDLQQRINREGTARLAAAALAAGVRRFIFLSSAKVFGEGDDGPYSISSPARPQDAYASAKWQAEQALRELAANSPMEVVIIRPPLVYGPGVGGNFARLIQLARLPLPLPVAAINNRRDLIGIDNLADLIGTCIDHPNAANNTVLCSDGRPYSLAELLSHIRVAYGRPRRLFALPAPWVNALTSAVLGPAARQRLLGNFELDIDSTRQALAWTPPFDMPTMLDRLRRQSPS